MKVKTTTKPSKNGHISPGLHSLNGVIRVVNGLTQSVRNAERTFLARRSAGSDTPNIDPRRNIAGECGWPIDPAIELYKELHEMVGVANRANNVFPDECWAISPEVYETEEDIETPFEKAWTEIVDELCPFHYLHRADVLSGVGRYGVMLFGFSDGPLDSPAVIYNNDGTRRSNSTAGRADRKLLYLRTFDETQVRIETKEQNKFNFRYGLPTLYTLNLANAEELNLEGPNLLTAQYTSAGTETKVHWTRILHLADNRTSSELFGIPRCKPILPNIADLRKILGGSAEMLWQGGFPGFSFETFPEVVDEDEINMETVREQIYAYVNGLQRYMAVQGMTIKSLTPQVADPASHVEQQLRLLCATLRVPMRVFLGSEAGHLASEQDAVTWNKRVMARQKNYINPMVLRPFVKRLIDVGVLPKPEKIICAWNDLNALTDLQKADKAMKKSQAVAQYVTGACETVMPPIWFFTEVMELPLGKAQLIVDSVAKNLKEMKTSEMWKKPEPVPGAAPGATKSSNRPARNGLGAAKRK